MIVEEFYSEVQRTYYRISAKNMKEYEIVKNMRFRQKGYVDHGDIEILRENGIEYVISLTKENVDEYLERNPFLNELVKDRSVLEVMSIVCNCMLVNNYF